ncbi:hypothetical protein Rsub_08314 [Raphidocelis subcapitata]|uniref:Fatty acid desaturase domain-containing protein n=1 Tax=Raphidocelis subcapitata TaxID=307507 RepID=A0A2V0PBK9_9CHLO|nr:hypothetical protein Rsub_08314 [Raphidocelis subcapitata]|eukprot:GBF95283.1 hypothetical protein Rsub_08314 [Raphidocelis subcapitata]
MPGMAEDLRSRHPVVAEVTADLPGPLARRCDDEGARAGKRRKPAAAAAPAPAAADAGAGDGDDYAAVLRAARAHISSFAQPDDRLATWTVFSTWAAWIGFLIAGLCVLRPEVLSQPWGIPLAALWTLLRIGSLVRAFVVFHDLAHHALFTKKRPNVACGVFVGVLVGSDYFDYRASHNIHHIESGLEDLKDAQSTVIWNAKEWAAWPRGIAKAAARMLWDPLFLYTVGGPIFLLLCNTCWMPLRRDKSGVYKVLYPLARVAAIPALFAAISYVASSTKLQIVMEVFCMLTATAYAMFLFHIQHVFEGTYRMPRGKHSRTEAAARGSSQLRIPRWWRWATLGVEHHAIHHINHRVPCYKLQECYETAPPGLWEAIGMPLLGAREACHGMLLTVWDADQHCYVAFPEWRWLANLLAP